MTVKIQTISQFPLYQPQERLGWSLRARRWIYVELYLYFISLLNISYIIDFSFIAEFMQLMMVPGEHHCQIHKLFILLTQQLEHEMYSEMTFQQEEFDFPL